MNQSNEECMLKYLEDANKTCNRDTSDDYVRPDSKKKSRGWFTPKQLDTSEGCKQMRDGYKVLVNMARNMPSPKNAGPQDNTCPQVPNPNTGEFEQSVQDTNSNGQNVARKSAGTARSIISSAMSGDPRQLAQTRRNLAGQIPRNMNPSGRIGNAPSSAAEGFKSPLALPAPLAAETPGADDEDADLVQPTGSAKQLGILEKEQDDDDMEKVD